MAEVKVHNFKGGKATVSWSGGHCILDNIDEHSLRDVITTAWRNVAPKTVVAAFNETDNRE